MYGHNFIGPNNQYLKDLFEYYEDALWYYAGSTLQTEEEMKNLIHGWHWFITNPAYGSQKLLADEIKPDQVERFKTCRQRTLKRCHMKHFQTLQCVKRSISWMLKTNFRSRMNSKFKQT